MKMSIHILQFENGKIVNTDIVIQRIYCKFRVIHFLKSSMYIPPIGFSCFVYIS